MNPETVNRLIKIANSEGLTVSSDLLSLQIPLESYRKSTLYSKIVNILMLSFLSFIFISFVIMAFVTTAISVSSVVVFVIFLAMMAFVIYTVVWRNYIREIAPLLEPNEKIRIYIHAFLSKDWQGYLQIKIPDYLRSV